MLRSTRMRRALGALGALVVTGAAMTACAPDSRISVDAPTQVSGDFPDQTLSQLQEAVDAAISSTASTGAIVGVWAPWSGSWVAAVGTDADGGELNTRMGFRIGDLTQLMTCDVLYGLDADGVLSVDDPVSDWVVGAPDLSDVSLLQLCNGSSGLGSSRPALANEWITNPDRVWTPLELAAQGLGASRSTPGTVYRDSDAGFVLLGLALEHASGRTAAELYEQYVFDPVGMGDSTLPGSAPAVPHAGGGTFPGYRLEQGEDGTWNCSAPVDASRLSASMAFTDSGVVSTVSDMGAYFRALGAGALDRGEAGEQRWSAPLPASSNAPAWFTATGGGLLAGSLIGQYGWMPGYITAGYVDPGTGMTVVVALNNSTASRANSNDLAWELAAIASKAPAADGQTAPQFGLPWTAETYGQKIQDRALDCG